MGTVPETRQSGLVTLLFTDVVGSTALKQQLGDRAGVDLVQEHHALFHRIFEQFAGAEEIVVAGDSFLVLFPVPSDAVKCALLLQVRLRQFNQGRALPMADRMGLHMGEVRIEHTGPGSRNVHGMQVDECARVMSLAQAGQILMTRPVFDNARQSLKGEELEGTSALEWLNHGRYELKGVSEPVEICEVRGTELAGPPPPTTSEKARRVEAAEGEAVLGWRPAVGTAVPNTQWMLEEKLGEGGFGEVWLGRHQTMKERRVFKFCFRADRVRSLKREMTLFRLIKERIGDHPNIVALREVYFEQPPYYVEEDYVASQDLASWCAAQGGAEKVPLEVKLEIVAQVGDALQAAHDAGVIHRDVKPANILVSRLPALESKAMAKLTDFGIGQVISEEFLKGVTRAGFTQTIVADASSSHTGSQLYMAPELLAGKPASIRSDIYSLGAVLYQLLVGDFARPVTTDWAKQVEDPLLREDLQHCFAGNPEDRFAGAGQLAKHLRAWEQRRQEFLARERMLKQAALRHRVALLSAGVAGLFLLLAIALGYGLRQAQKAKAGEARLRKLAEAQAYASDMRAAQVASQQDNRGLAMSLLYRHQPKPGETDLRGVEWRYLWQECRSDELQSFSHPWIVNTAALSPNGRYVATAGGDGRIRVWDVGSGKTVQQYEAEQDWGPRRAVAFSPDGEWLAVARKDQIEIRDTSKWSVIQELKSAWPPLAISADGKHLAAAGANGLTIWEARNWSSRVLTNAAAGWNNLAFTADGSWIACCPASTASGVKSQILLWDVERGTSSPLGEEDTTISLAISRNGRWAASGNWEGEACLWDLSSRQLIRRFPAHGGLLLAIAFSPDCSILATGGNDQRIQLWETETTNRLTSLQGHLNEIWSLDFSKDGQTLVSSSKDGTAKLWSIKPGPARSRTFALATDSLPIGPLADGGALVTADSKARKSELRGLPDGRLIRSLDWTEFEQQGCLRFTHFPTSDSVVGMATNGTVHLWSLGTGVHLRSVQLGDTDFRPRGLSQDHRWLLGSLSGGNGATLYDLRGARPVHHFPESEGRHAAFSRDGHWLAYETTNFPAIIKIWDLSGNRERAILKGLTWDIAWLQFSPDEQLLACGCNDGDVWLWSANSGKLLMPSLKGHQSGVIAGTFSADSKTLITGSNDRTIRWWNVATGQEMLLFRSVNFATSDIPQTEWDLAGRTVVWQERQGTVRVAPLPTLAEIDAAEHATTTSLHR